MSAGHVDANSSLEWVKSLFEELRDPQVLEVALTPGAEVECRGGAGILRRHPMPAPAVAAVLAKMKKLAGLDVAERHRAQSGRLRLLNFHGSPASYQVATFPAGAGEMLTLRHL